MLIECVENNQHHLELIIARVPWTGNVLPMAPAVREPIVEKWRPRLFCQSHYRQNQRRSKPKISPVSKRWTKSWSIANIDHSRIKTR